MFYKSVIIALSAISLTGCMSHYGNFAEATLDGNQKMAEDTVSQLTKIYPPAQTRFNVKQPIKDSYGIALIKLLRAKGYSLAESQGVGVKATQGSYGQDLFYVVDAPIKSSLYRVTVMIGQESLSRAYTLKDDTMFPMGHWVRKE